MVEHQDYLETVIAEVKSDRTWEFPEEKKEALLRDMAWLLMNL